jgi:MFS family permease
MVAMNLVYAVTAYPFGRLADQLSHSTLLGFGLVVLIAADVVLAVAGHWSTVIVGVGLWGMHMGMTQGLLAAMVADHAPEDLRGTAYGFFNLACGVAMLAASVVAGLLWDRLGPAVTFWAGAAFCTVTIVGLSLSAMGRSSRPAV